MSLTTILKPSQLREALVTCIKAGRPAYVESMPGLGKTSIVKQLAKELDCHLLDPSALTLESVDFRGVPMIEKRTEDNGDVVPVTRWARPEFLDLPSDKPTILFFDDMAAAQPSVQIAMFQVLLEKQSGPHKLRQDVIIIGAGNGVKDGAGASRLFTPIRTRLVQFVLQADTDDWCNWATANGINPTIPAFIRWRPDLLHQPDNAQMAMPTPRTWEFVSQLLAASTPKEKPKTKGKDSEDSDSEDMVLGASPMIQAALIEGAVGPGAAAEFNAFLKLWQGLPKIEDILSGKAKKLKFDGKDGVSLKYAVTYALAARADEKNFGTITEWLNDNLSPEFLIMGCKAALLRDKELQKHPAWKVAAEKHIAPHLI